MRHPDANGDGNANSDTYTDCNTNSHGYGYVHADSYGYGYVHADSYSNGYSDGNSDLNAYPNCGEAFADAESASHAAAAASVVRIGKWNTSGENSRETLASSPPEVDWLLLIFARSAFGVRCVLASLFET